MTWRNRITGSGEEDPRRLTPNPRNWRKHPKQQAAGLIGSLEEVGWVQDIIINTRTGRLVDGHLRVELAIQNKEKTVPVKYVDLSEDEEALVLATLDPLGAMAEADKDRLADLLKSIDTESEPLQELLTSIGKDFSLPSEEPKDTEPQINRATELMKEWGTEPGQLWNLGPHRILCGDSTRKEDMDRLMQGEKAELLFTSPPYSDMRDYLAESDLNPKHLSEFISVFSPLVKYQCINLGLKIRDHEVEEYWKDYIDIAKKAGYKFLSWNIWDKGECGSIGNQKAMFSIVHEWIFVFGKEKKELNKIIPCKCAGGLTRATRRQKSGELIKINKFEISPSKQIETITRVPPAKKHLQHSNIHPAQYPTLLPLEYIASLTIEGDLVVDPFLGSGTTLIACENLGRICRGMEIAPEYIAVTLQRYRDTFGKEPKLEEK
jgi:DNA modification methylase